MTADTWGVEGIGKSRLVEHLRARCRAEGVVDLSIAIEAPSPPTTLSAAYHVLETRLKGLSEILRDVPGGGARAFADFEQRVARQRQTLHLDMSNKTNVKNSTITGSPVGNQRADVSAAIDDLQRQHVRALVDDFVECFNELMRSHSALVTVDGFGAIGGTELGQWCLEFFGRLDNTLVVLTRTPAGPRVEDAELPTLLEPFTRRDVADLLSARAGEDVPERIVDIVLAWSEGHPFSADVAAKLYAETGRGGSADDFRVQLAGLWPDDEQARIALAIVPEDLREAVRACSVARRFDCGLFEALAGPLPDGADAAVERLLACGVAERAGGKDGGLYRLHSYVRLPLQESLGVDPNRRRELNARAADYYYAQVAGDEEEAEGGDDAPDYDAWYQYEDPHWQEQMREWLFHQRAAAKPGDLLPRLRFARVFLDVFWWWECYLPYPFCTDLIHDWRACARDESEWLADMEAFHAAYPTGYRKQGAPRWSEATSALLGLRRSVGVDGDVDALDSPDARHVRALTGTFLAHACRYREGADDVERGRLYERAVRYYAEAEALFAQNDDEWNRSWSLFELAELHVDHGAVDQARGPWREAALLEFAAESPDEEVRANLHRVRADVAWAAGDRTAAFAAHGLANLHAFLFHVHTPKGRPDAYTRKFALEQIERAIERLFSAPPGEAAAGAASLRAPFGLEPVDEAELLPLVEARKGDAVAALVFPEPPGPEALGEARSPFVATWDLLVEQLPDAPDRDLDGLELDG